MNRKITQFESDYEYFGDWFGVKDTLELADKR